MVGVRSPDVIGRIGGATRITSDNWADGGPTGLGNLVLLCGHHHRLIHHSDWACAIVNGCAEFYLPCYVDPSRRRRRNVLHPQGGLIVRRRVHQRDRRVGEIPGN